MLYELRKDDVVIASTETFDALVLESKKNKDTLVYQDGVLIGKVDLKGKVQTFTPF